MAPVDPNELRKFLGDKELPGLTYILIWGELDEDSEGYTALSQVLFEQVAVGDPEVAPTRDLGDFKVRAGVVDCAIRYPEVGRATAKLMRRLRKPWWKFW
jgi:hypothetical protein